VRIGDRLVRQHELGDGRPLVLLHGLGGSWRWWSTLFPALAAGRRLYVPELPRPPVALPSAAMGSWVLQWLDAAGLERVDVVAHSLGGLFAAELAAIAPDRVSRLVLVAPAGIPRGIALVDGRDLTEELAEISAPTLLVWGARDRLVPSRLAREWQRLIPQARLVLLECGHVPMLEAPDELTAAIRSFLDF
jgi:pimeloyl-ACP methyl ester carboxylesterase